MTRETVKHCLYAVCGDCSGLKFGNKGAQFVLVHKAHESVHNLTWKKKLFFISQNNNFFISSPCSIVSKNEQDPGPRPGSMMRSLQIQMHIITLTNKLTWVHTELENHFLLPPPGKRLSIEEHGISLSLYLDFFRFLFRIRSLNIGKIREKLSVSQCCGSSMFIPDTGSQFVHPASQMQRQKGTGSRIRIHNTAHSAKQAFA